MGGPPARTEKRRGKHRGRGKQPTFLGRNGGTERASFRSAYDEVLLAVRYLMRELELLREHFSPRGVELLADLRHQTDQL
ncbi:hypothetical protein [Kitasatospora sp. NPDC093102]|uniref:hypothetical protein n=1 Tax=Kitasatospora sp. NPDC093102 TaxID=3155069 RepID=UPI003416E991